MEFFKELFIFLGRIAISTMFIWGAVDRAMNWQGSVANLKTKKIPYMDLILGTAIGLQIIGGLMVFFGLYAHVGAILLLLVLVPSALYLHCFWKHSGPERMIEKHLFMKDVAILGAILLLIAIGAGTWGVN